MSGQVWTRFFDMSSGGREKLPFGVIWVEAPEAKAARIFEDMTGRDPDNVTCACCGPDYSFYEAEFKPKDGDALVSAADIEAFRTHGIRKIGGDE